MRLTVLLDEAAAQGDLAFIKWVRHKTNYMCDIRAEDIAAAVKAGHLAILQLFYVLQPKVKLAAVY